MNYPTARNTYQHIIAQYLILYRVLTMLIAVKRLQDSLCDIGTGPSVDQDKPTLSATFDRTPSVYIAGDTATLYIDAKDDKSAVDVTITVDGGMSRTITGPTATVDTTGFALGSRATLGTLVPTVHNYI